jgi:hypothetical protein
MDGGGFGKNRSSTKVGKMDAWLKDVFEKIITCA